MEKLELILKIEKKSIGNRVDIYLKDNSKFSRSRISDLISKGYVKEDGILINKSSYKIKGKVITIDKITPEPLNLSPENIDIDIVYEDEDIAVINKKSGIVVHPGAGNRSGTLVNALLYHLKDLSTIGSKIRPGIVHRLDKDTSGLMVVAKNNQAHIDLSEQFKSRSVIKKYFAIVEGTLKNEGRLEDKISRDKKNRKRMAINSVGKNAVTNFKVLLNKDNLSLLDIKIETGRTHQIRVQLSHLGYPLLGDRLYGSKRGYKYYLHCYHLGFIHPKKKEIVNFSTNMPEEFKSILG